MGYLEYIPVRGMLSSLIYFFVFICDYAMAKQKKYRSLFATPVNIIKPYYFFMLSMVNE